MKRVYLFMVMMMLLCLSACGTDRSSVKMPESSPVVSEPQFETQAVFELTEQGKVFLGQMCRTLNDFDLQTTKDERFWLDFLFRSYTGMGEEEETERINRGELGIETVVKVSLERAKKRAKLVFGTDLPDIRPSYEDMERGQYSCYYHEGYYYIGVSDFPDYEYSFVDCEESDGLITARYTIDSGGESNGGMVTFTIVQEANENGFIIISKTTEMFD